MFGSVVVFLVVCAIVSVYMCIVHSFLREAEKVDTEETMPVASPADHDAESHEIHRAPREQWAH